MQIQYAGILSGFLVFSQAGTSESVEEDWSKKKGRRAPICDKDQLFHSAATEGRWRTNTQVNIVVTSICRVAHHNLMVYTVLCIPSSVYCED